MKNSGFSVTELKVETADGHIFRLFESFSYTRKDGTVIIVPIGTESNGASVPRLFWRVLPPFGCYWKAAFLHDYMYESGLYSKEFCDGTLLEAMEFLEVPDVEAHTIYEGVHLFGWPAYAACREAQNHNG